MTAAIPALEGVATADEIAATAAAVAKWQLPNGMIPWFPGGHSDPWNHIEAAMALGVAGEHDAAVRAFGWLKELQREDGSWHQYYTADGVEESKLDANCVAYIAAGVWHRFLLTGDRDFLEEYWPVVEKAVGFVLELQQPRGEILWARHDDGTPWSFALLTGSSSVCHSLRCAIAIAETLEHERPDWELSAARLSHVIANDPDAFAPKHRWAMDWYYPVLCGILTGDRGREHLAARWDTFVMDGRGVRCVSDRPWVTAAETSECAIAHMHVGEHEKARQLMSWIPQLRNDDDHYWTGIVLPQEVHFPADETSTYSAAAVILAVDTLSRTTPASGLFVGDDLPELIEIDTTDPIDSH